MPQTRDVLRAWAAILEGRQPALSIELTKTCPLHCPGCYAFSEGHVASGVNLRDLHDLQGDALVDGVLELVDRMRPLHVSLVGGDPLVRFRELERLLPRLLQRGVFVQVVTSAFRPIPAHWAQWEGFELVVSIDGLQPDHDLRRQPATYARIRKHIAGQHVVVHCTITAPMTRREGYLEEFVRTWSDNPDVKKIWMSIFTPQRGAELAEIPNAAERAAVIAELRRLNTRYAKLQMPEGVLAALEHPPASPAACVFAQTTAVVSADLKSRVAPCQFGGDPDCARCGCFASMGLEAIARHKLAPGLRVGAIFSASQALGRWRQRAA